MITRLDGIDILQGYNVHGLQPKCGPILRVINKSKLRRLKRVSKTPWHIDVKYAIRLWERYCKAVNHA